MPKYRYELEYNGHRVEIDADEELTDDEIEEAAESSFEGVSETPIAQSKKSPGLVDMIAPSLNRELSESEQQQKKVQTDFAKANPNLMVSAGPGGIPYGAYQDSRRLEGAMDAVNTGARAIGAAIPSDFTRGTNEDGTTKSFTEAMADSQTGATRGLREAAANRLSQSFQAMKDSEGVVDKALNGAAAGMYGLGFLFASAIEPGGSGLARLFGKGAKAGLTAGRSVARNTAETFLNETGVPRSSLERLAEEGGTKAIKDASNDVDTDWQQVIKERIDAIRAPKLDEISKTEKKALETYQDRLSEIMEMKSNKTAEAQEAMNAKLMELDQEVRDFMENIKVKKGSSTEAAKAELEGGTENIKAGAKDLKDVEAANAPGAIRGEIPKADRLGSGDRLQGSLRTAEDELSERYGELKNNAFGFNEATFSVIPGRHNPISRAWDRVQRNALEKYGENALSPTDKTAFEKLIGGVSGEHGPLTIGGLVNARRHIGKAIYGRSGIKEQDELFSGVNRALKEDFYQAINDEIGNELGGFYRRKGIPDPIIEKMLDGWDKFNGEYASLRRGMEKVEKGIGFKKEGGKVESYVGKLFTMGANDLKKAKTATLSTEATRPVWEAIEGAAINDLVEQATDANGVFSIKKFNQNWGELSRNSRDKMVALLGEDRVKAVDAYNAKMQQSLDEIDAVAQGDIDALVQRIARKKRAIEAKTQTAQGAVSVYKKARTASLKSQLDEAKVGIDKAIASRKETAREMRDNLLSMLDYKRDQIEAIGTVAIAGRGQGRTQLAQAVTPTNMTGPRRKAIMDEMTKRFGAEEAQKIQDVFHARAIGAKDGRIPMFTRAPTGRSLFLGFVSGHPLAAAIATSPIVAAKALQYGRKPATKLGVAVDAVMDSPKLINLYQVLGGLKKVEARNRVLLRIMQELEKEGIDVEALEPENEEAPADFSAGALQVSN